MDLKLGKGEWSGGGDVIALTLIISRVHVTIIGRAPKCIETNSSTYN